MGPSGTALGKERTGNGNEVSAVRSEDHAGDRAVTWNPDQPGAMNPWTASVEAAQSRERNGIRGEDRRVARETFAAQVAARTPGAFEKKGRNPGIARIPPCVAEPRFPWAVPFGPCAVRRHDPAGHESCIAERPVPSGRFGRFEL